MINRLFFVGKFNGPDNRLNRDWFPHLYVRTVMVPCNVRWFAVISFFESIEECLHYATQLKDIKNFMEELNQQRTDGTISTIIYATKLEFEWIPMIDCFIVKWGTDMVPHNVRHSVDDVKRSIVSPPYDWPVNVDVPSEVIAEVSLFTPPHNDKLEIIDLSNEESAPE
jgi:hypothetical protein